MIVSKLMTSSQEGSRKRVGIIIHDPEAARTESSERFRDSRCLDRKWNQQQSSDDEELITSMS